MYCTRWSSLTGESLPPNQHSWFGRLRELRNTASYSLIQGDIGQDDANVLPRGDRG